MQIIVDFYYIVILDRIFICSKCIDLLYFVYFPKLFFKVEKSIIPVLTTGIIYIFMLSFH